MNNISIKVDNVEKSYGETKALKDISFEINKNEIFGFIGPDGAGKTTLFRILTSLMVPDKGTAVVEGFDIVKDFKKLRKILGYMPGRFSLYHDLSVEENLKFFATIFGTTIKENYDLIKDIYSQIEPFKKRPAGKLSGGMKQKLALSCALIHKPVVLILDEPTTGVDAVSRKEFWEMLIRLKEKGITIVVSTPYMDEASLCDRVALIQNGNIMRIDTPESIIKDYKRKLLSVRSDDMFRLINDLKNFRKTYSAYPFGQSIHFTSIDNDVSGQELMNYLKMMGHDNAEIKAIEANIEDSFMDLMVKEN
jgi:ABC-2 type transport system ATP-binding protein